MKTKVLVAMSGGVDSSTSAMLLKDAGYEVHGAYLRLWRYGASPADPDPAEDARNVSRFLDIPLHMLDLQQRFKERIVNRFIEQYLQGRTPNPCTICNRDIKFEVLLGKADEIGAQFLATGHYAKTERSPDGKKWRLLRGRVPRKDQSYFLFTLTQERLARIIFPLADMTKEEVRIIAGQRGLPVAEKSESQDICFISKGHYSDLIAAELKEKDPGPGDIVDGQGNVLGRHRGFYRYTLGQRKGLELAAGKPVYIIRLDPQKNQVVVGEKAATFSQQMIVREVNWISGDNPDPEIELQVKIRYNSPLQPARMEILSDDRVKVVFATPQAAVTPGQAAVFYSDQEVIGGGWIE